MARCIDADALKDVIQQHDYPLSDKLNSIGNGMFTLGIFQAIDQMPTISPDEVRGVVHCGECKFWRRPPSCEGLARCETGETGIRYRTKNDFCSRGARMGGVQDALS